MNLDVTRAFQRARNPMFQTVKELPATSMRQVGSDLFIWGAGLSVALSLGLRLAGRRDDALFVGEWVPSMLLLGVLTRL